MLAPVSGSGFSFSSFGFAGSRFGSGVAAGFLAAVVSLAGASVLTTCAAGVCAGVRVAVPSARVFSVASVPPSVPFRGRLVVRAVSFVRALSVAPAPVLLCWPGCAAPVAARPAPSWVSCGSGSWSELALAVGLGVPVVVFLPPSSLPPSSWGAWSFVSGGSLAGGWHLAPPPRLV